MNCMKCGRDISTEQVFCPECLTEMARYPVKPGTPVNLPVHPKDPDPRKKPVKAKRTLTPEEQVPRLRSSLRLMVWALILTFLAFAFTAWLTLQLLDKQKAVPMRMAQSSFVQNNL